MEWILVIYFGVGVEEVGRERGGGVSVSRFWGRLVLVGLGG